MNGACLLVQLVSYRFDSVASYGCEDGVDLSKEACRGWRGVNVIYGYLVLSCLEHGIR